MKLLPLAALLSTAIALPRGQPTHNVFDEEDTCEADDPEPSVTSEAAAVPTVTMPSSAGVVNSVPALTLVATTSAAAMTSAGIGPSSAASPAQASSAAGGSAASSSAAASTNVTGSGGNTTYAGVNIAGFDFGCSTDGNCVVSNAVGPLTNLNGPDGIGQMKHFFTDDGMNIFRLPVAWQYLTNSASDYSTLDTTNFGNYDQLVQGCLATGAKCIIDIHNYARYNGKIVGQDSGAPTADQFAALWSNIATKYADSDSVVFGVMNEPHDVSTKLLEPPAPVLFRGSLTYSGRHYDLGPNRANRCHRHTQGHWQYLPHDPPSWHAIYVGHRFRVRRLVRRLVKSDQLRRKHHESDLRRSSIPRQRQQRYTHHLCDRQHCRSRNSAGQAGECWSAGNPQ